MIIDQNAAKDALLLGFPEYKGAAKRLAEAAGLPFAEIEIHSFPDGESRLRLPEKLPQHVIVCRSLNQPNQKLIELALVAATARKLGASRLVLVAPYLCYMRQDKAFRAGEAVSQRIVGSLLAQWFDEVLTVDPHLHRVKKISQAVPATRSIALSATGLIAEYLASNSDNPFLVGPDEESEQWVAAAAQKGRLDYAVGHKERLGDRKVVLKLPEANYRGRHLVLLDDIASTGQTLEMTARKLSACAPASISVLVTHALFIDNAIERLKRAGISRIWSTDSIPHATNVIHLAGLLATAL